MNELLLKRESELDKLADEIVELVTNSRRLSDILKTIQENEIIQKESLSEVATLKNRITILENRLDKLIKSFRIDVVEAERSITEKYEKLDENMEKHVVSLQSQIEELRNAFKKVTKYK